MIFVSPLSASFGTVPVGTTSVQQVVTVRNDGGTSLILGTLTLGGANPGEFKKPTPNEFCTGVTLAPMQQCTVWVRYRPTTAGLKSATLVIPSNDPSQPTVTVTLSGTGTVIFVSPLSAPFGTVPVGTTSVQQVVTVRNDGTASLILGTLTLGGTNPGEFKKPTPNEFCTGVTLAPAQQCTVWVRYRPTSLGDKNATLVIPSNDAGQPTVTVTLSGTGGP